MPSYIRNSHLILLVYDLSSSWIVDLDKKTFESIEKWLKFVE